MRFSPLQIEEGSATLSNGLPMWQSLTLSFSPLKVEEGSATYLQEKVSHG